jgi:hypothetical protein
VRATSRANVCGVGATERREIDLFARFSPTPSQLKFFQSPAFGRLFSSGYGSGKSKTGCREGIRWAVMYAGSRGMIGRQTATKLNDTTMVTFWEEMGEIGFKKADTEADLKKGRGHYVHNKADRSVTFWNGSTILYRHLDDAEALGSLELNWAFIDEGSEVDDMIYKTISSSRLRWHIKGCDFKDRVRRAIDAGATPEEIKKMKCSHCPYAMWVCTNPGASGYLRAVTRGEVPRWEWIPAKVGDNPYNGQEYYDRMEEDRRVNGDVWMRRYYEGSWEAFEGQRFPMFDRDTHTAELAFQPNERHMVICGWDFGNIETVIAFLAWVPDGSEPVTVFDEIVVNDVNDPKFVADLVNDRIRSYGLTRVMHLGDPAGANRNEYSLETPIGAYGAYGLHIAPARKAKSPTGRADHLNKFINIRKKVHDGTEWPGIVFVRNKTERVVASIIDLRWKPQVGKLGEDPREVFVDKNKHGFDAVTYALHGVPPPELPKPKPKRLANANIGLRQALNGG